VPEIVLAKPARAWVRSRSTPSRSTTLRLMEKTTRSAVARRLSRLLRARARIGMSGVGCRRSRGEVGEGEHA
jgi:hypothetical protein